MADSARCLLGAKATSIYDIRLPCFASFKLDGIRARWWHLEFMSRTFKTLPSRTLREYASPYLEGATGWDGEIVVGSPTAPDCFRRTDSFVTSRAGAIPSDGVRFFVFDNCLAGEGYDKRLATLHDRPPFVVKLDQKIITTYEEFETFEDYAVTRGYEGIVCRSPTGRYKNGRSTLKEQCLVKVKRFEHDEGKIIGFGELLHNANPATLDERGYTKRSSHREGRVASGTLGKIVVDWQGKEVRVGTFKGYTKPELQRIWDHRDLYLGGTLEFRFFPVGMKDLPRHPTGLKIRARGT